MDSASLVELKRKIEKEVLRVIHNLAKENARPPSYLSSMAQTALDLLEPAQTIDELYRNAIRLDDNFPELSEIVYTLLEEYEKKYQESAVRLASQLVKQGQYELAEQTIKKFLEFKINKYG